MSPITDLAGRAGPSTDVKVIGLVSGAHFVSHFYIILLAPLFALVRIDFGVSYTELGAAISIFNIFSALLQPPAGLLVDRVSARAVLIGALLLGASAVALAAMVPTFWLFVAMIALVGVANAVYHPANYTLLSNSVTLSRMSRAYSIHTFAGMLGNASAPAALLAVAAIFGWRGAFFAASLLGFAMALLLILRGGGLTGRVPPKVRNETGKAPSTLQLLLSAPILMNLAFYIVSAMGSGAVMNFSVVALEASHGTPLAVGNVALTTYLLLSALGILIGGIAAGRTNNHTLLAATGLLLNGIMLGSIALFSWQAALLIGMMGFGGFCNGLVAPSRDMIVRSVTPPGQYGTVFGFVTTGFNIGGIFAPLFFGWLMDHGNPQAVLITAALCCLTCIPLVFVGRAVRGG
jgi:FSR family fosmidomycin resistance protein-like MFS transporter